MSTAHSMSAVASICLSMKYGQTKTTYFDVRSATRMSAVGPLLQTRRKHLRAAAVLPRWVVLLLAHSARSSVWLLVWSSPMLC